MVQFVFLNGPPRSGKDTVVSHLVQYIPFRHLKFAAPIKRATAGLLDISASTLEDWKEKKPSIFHRSGSIMEYDTVREHLIWYFSALAFRYGDDILGRVLWQDAKTSARQLCIVSDSGKVEEVRYVIKQAGSSNCVIMRLHRDRCTFDGDNRSYLPDGMCATHDLYNDGSREKVAVFALHIIRKHFDVELLKEVSWQPTFANS
jgi:hypothetical protein